MITHSGRHKIAHNDPLGRLKSAFFNQPFISSPLYAALLDWVGAEDKTREPVGAAGMSRPFASMLPIIQVRALFGRFMQLACSSSVSCGLEQSSGTGKSRAMHELAGTLFTFPMVLRESNTHEKAFPPGSSSLFAMLCATSSLRDHSCPGHPMLARMQTAYVLLATLQTCAEWLDEDEEMGSEDMLNTPRGWRDKLYGVKQSAYEHFYSQVETAVSKASVDASPEGWCNPGTHCI